MCQYANSRTEKRHCEGDSLKQSRNCLNFDLCDYFDYYDFLIIILNKKITV